MDQGWVDKQKALGFVIEELGHNTFATSSI
jgi:hypothetical protein